jgi:hypothetical protein
MIHGFMHVATLGHGEQIHLEQLDIIRKSGLYDATRKIQIGVVGRNCRAYGDNDKLTIGYRSRQVEEHEFPTLRMLHTAAAKMNPDDHVWYLHTKGANSYRPSQPGPLGWRKFMEYYVAQHWRFTRAALAGYDVAGVQFRPEPWPHFSGNFWWARAGYLQMLPVPTLKTSRTEAEQWLGLSGPKFYTAMRWCIPDLYAKIPDPGIYSFFEPIRERLQARGDLLDEQLNALAYLVMFLNSREVGMARVLDVGMAGGGAMGAGLSEVTEVGQYFGVLLSGEVSPAMQNTLAQSCFTDCRLAKASPDEPAAPFLPGWTDPFDLAIVAGSLSDEQAARAVEAAGPRLRPGGMLAVMRHDSTPSVRANLSRLAGFNVLWDLEGPFGWVVATKT